jgi:hypothetical protein
MDRMQGLFWMFFGSFLLLFTLPFLKLGIIGTGISIILGYLIPSKMVGAFSTDPTIKDQKRVNFLLAIGVFYLVLYFAIPYMPIWGFISEYSLGITIGCFIAAMQEFIRLRKGYQRKVEIIRDEKQQKLDV